MFPNLKNKKFTDITTNESFVVIDQFENIAILNNKERVDVKKLLDRNYYDEYIDPNTFFDEKNLQVFTEKIKSISTEMLDNIRDDDGPAVMPYDPEEEKRLLQQKANEMYKVDPSNIARSQMEKFKDLMDEEDIPTTFKVDQERINEEMGQSPSPSVVSYQQDIYTQTHIEKPTQDPILSMFKNVKRNVDFKISIDVIDKIPRTDFIEMMEDSYDISIIDFLAEEFTQGIIKDPSIIKHRIKDEIKRIVYKTKKDRNIQSASPQPPTPPIDRQVNEGENPEGVYKKRKYTKKQQI